MSTPPLLDLDEAWEVVDELQPDGLNGSARAARIIAAFAARVRQEERERCAKVAERAREGFLSQMADCHDIARAIRLLDGGKEGK